MLDSEFEQEFWYLIEKGRTRHLWNASGQLSEEVNDNVHRIAICLMREYPQCKTFREIESITGVPNSTVSDNMSGKIESVRQYFRKCKKGYQLTDFGIIWLRTEVIPRYSSSQNE